MKNILIAMSMCLLLFPYLVMAGQPESGLTCVEGDDLGMAYGQYADCELEDNSDQDAIEFEGTAGDIVRVFVIDFYQPLEVRIEVYDPDNMKIYDFWDYQSYFVDFGHGTNPALPKTGTYRMVFSEVAQDETGTYLIQLEKIPPVSLPPILSYDYPKTDTLDHQGDMDFFAFYGVLSSSVRLTVDDQYTAPEFHLEIWKPDGSRVTNTWEYNTYYDDLLLDQTGDYLVGVYEVGLDETGEYTLEINCNYGPCPECEDDNDGDGYADPAGDADCPYPEQDCNDSDELIYPTNSNTYCDCQDPYPQGTTEDCTGGVDEDCDGFTDCADSDCIDDYSCTANAQASTYGSNSVAGSGIFNELALLLIPIGAVIFLRTLRRKR